VLTKETADAIYGPLYWGYEKMPAAVQRAFIWWVSHWMSGETAS